MKQRVVSVKNKAGIHCRPSSAILTAIMNDFPDHSFTLITPEGESELTSILSLIALGLQCGQTATLRVIGDNEEEAIVSIGDLFEREFDFPPKQD